MEIRTQASTQHANWSTLVAEGSAGEISVDSWIQAARAGDDSAFNALAIYYSASAQSLARQILHTEEAAADAVQDSLVKVYRALPRFKDGNFRSWLLRIVTNTCYDHLRRQRRRPAISLDALLEQTHTEPFLPREDDRYNPERAALCEETMNTLLTAINTLPAWHRNVVLLIDVHGHDYAEAAQLLDVPLGTVKSRLSRARAVLRDHLMNEGIVPWRTQRVADDTLSFL